MNGGWAVKFVTNEPNKQIIFSFILPRNLLQSLFHAAR